MSRTKDYYEKRAEELGLDIELIDETVDKIIQADLALEEKEDK